jgi:outer membrane protein assembly factor BamB
MLDEKRIIFGGCDAFLHIVNLENGESIEQYETNAYIPCSVAVYDGIGYSGNYANEVLAFDPGDRGQLWTYSDRQFPFFSSPAVNETHVFIGSRDKRLHAIDREMGVAAWTYQTSGRVDSSPLAFSDAVVVGSTDGWLYAVSQIDGTELWKIELGASLIASPVFANGKLIIGSQGGTLFSLESGKTKI